MSREELLSIVVSCVNKVLDDEVEVTEQTHLVNDGILDSLDSATFIFELEAATNQHLPDGDLDEKELYLVSNLISHLAK